MTLHDLVLIALKDKTNRGLATKITLAIIINFYLLPSFDSECPFTPILAECPAFGFFLPFFTLPAQFCATALKS